MLSSELKSRANRLLAEQKARAEKDRQRLEKERLLAERQRARDQAREEEARRRRVAQQEAEERAKELAFEVLEHNRGVYLRLELQALPMDEGLAAAKGVRRSKDKVVLPASVGASLTSQDASRNGALLFEVALPACASVPSAPGAQPPAPPSTAAAPLEPTPANGGVLLPPADSTARAQSPPPSQQQQPGSAQPPLPHGCPGRTHAGVLEFTAPEGTVLLPRKVVQSLYGSLDAQPYGTVVVMYRRLDKGSYVRLQPMSHGFHEAMEQPEGGPQGTAEQGGAEGMGVGAAEGGWGQPHGLREVLERELLLHSTLSEGDWLTVTHGGKEWPLRVQELRPAAAVSIIDVDVEADVVPSLEAEQYLARWEEEQREQQARLAAIAAERAAAEAAEAAAAAARAATEAELAAAAAARRQALQEQLAASLPPEPSAEQAAAAGGGGVLCAFSLPDGVRVQRRFLLCDPVQLLFDFVDSRGAGGWERGSYQLVTRMPRRVVRAGGAGGGGGAPGAGGPTLRDVGLGGGSEALLLEPLPQEGAAGGQGAEGGDPMEVGGAAEATAAV